MASRRRAKTTEPVGHLEDARAVGRAPAPTDGHVLHRLQRAAGNHAVTQLLALGGRDVRLAAPPRADSADVTRRVPAVQRVVQLDGTTKSADQLVNRRRIAGFLAGLAPGDAARAQTVIATWCNAGITHNFEPKGTRSAARVFVKAIRRALDRTPVGPAAGALPPAPYLVGNLRFVTQANNRAPSLYFIDAAGSSGRLRQQHRSGPLAQAPATHKVDYFCASRGVLRNSHQLQQGSARLTPQQEATLGVQRVPALGHFHLELTYSSAAPDAVVAGRHMSEGVVVATPAYTQDQITAIYKAAIGQA